MLTLSASTRILLHREPVDFRKAHDGLAAIVRGALESNPLSGDLFVFLNRARDRVKLLQWDGNGLWMHYKRLEQGSFATLGHPRDGKATISRAELSMLLEGIELKKGRFSRRFADSLHIEERDGDDDADRKASRQRSRSAADAAGAKC